MPATSAEPLLQIDGISYRIGKKNILSNIDLHIHEREIVTLIGPNGAGKSTLLAVALGLKKPSAGRVQRRANLRIGYVPQSINRDATLPLRVSDFIRLAKRKIDPKTAQPLFADLGIDRLQSALLCDISGGELRRVLLARAMLNQPDLLVLDEPTAGIDASGQEAFYHRLNAWRQRQTLAILLVSHDLHLVMSATDRVVCLNQHICCQGQPIHVLQDPHYLALFGQKNRPDPELAFYEHRHHPTHEH